MSSTLNKKEILGNFFMAGILTWRKIFDLLIVLFITPRLFVLYGR